MYKTFKSYLLLIAIGILEITALTSLKTYNINHYSVYLIAAIVCYGLLCYFAKELFKLKVIAVSVAIWSALSMILAIFISIFYFKEKKHTMVFVGIAIVFIGIIIIDLYD